jgi:hypothetical protein
MADAHWEDKREGREKNSVPEQQYQMRLAQADAARVAEARRRNLPAPKQAVQEPATALDHIRGFRAGFKTYQALDMAQARKKKRRDNAPRQIARWRNSFGGKAEVLPDRFVAELALAERDGVAQVLSDPQTDEEVAPTATSVALPDAIAQSASGAAPANASESASRVAETGEPARAPIDNGSEALCPPAPVEKTAQVAPGETGQVAPPPAPAQESAQTEAEGASKIEPADAAPPRVPAHEVEVKMGGVTERINFVAWLRGAKRYAFDRLETAGEKAFERRFTSTRALVRYLVLECKMVRPDEVCPLLAPWLRGSEFPSLSLFGAAANAASSIGASGETPGAASPLASEADSAQVVPAEDPAGAQAAPSLPGAAEPAPAPADDGAKAMPPPAPTREVVQAAPAVGSSARSAALPDDAEAARRRVRAEHQQSTGPAASGANGQAAPPLASAQEIAQATTERGLRNEAADTATPRTPNEVAVELGGATERINWVAWLTGAKRYNWCFLSKAGEKAFERPFSSKRALVRHLVLVCKIVRPDQVCRVLEPWLRVPDFPSQSGTAANAASSNGASGETPESACRPPAASEAAQAHSGVGLACS